MKKGYSNRLFEADLSTNKVKISSLEKIAGKDWGKFLIGGRGLGAFLLYENIKPKTKAFDFNNILVIAPGPMTGSGWPSASKTVIISKSPATNAYGESSMGGETGARIKWADFDAMLIRGKSEHKTALVVDSINNQYYFTGLPESENAFDLAKKLIEEHGKNKTAVLTIGKAGENLIKYACVHGTHYSESNSEYISRQSGRTGMGAVMGSKNLEAIVIKSEPIRPNPYDKEIFKEYSKILYKFLKEHPFSTEKGTLTANGTPFLVPITQELNILPTKNFKYGQFTNFDKIGPESIKEKLGKKAYSCFGCNIKCGKFSTVDKKTVDLEYESIALLGSNLLLDNIEDVARAALLCDEYGLDTISTGNSIGFAIESKELGLLNKEKLIKFGVPIEDLDLLEWGNGKKILNLISKIANLEGIGKFIAKGVKTMSSFLPGTEKFAIQQKGVEYTGYVTTESPYMALAYGVSDFGAHHRRAWVITAERAKQVNMSILLFYEDFRSWFDMAGLCKLPWIDFPHPDSKDRKNEVVANWYLQGMNSLTGFGYKNLEEMLLPSVRISTLIKKFNIENGLSIRDDIPPIRVLNHAYPNMTEENKIKSYKKLLFEYYKERGWNEKGIPKKETIRKLGLEQIVK